MRYPFSRSSPNAEWRRLHFGFVLRVGLIASRSRKALHVLSPLPVKNKIFKLKIKGEVSGDFFYRVPSDRPPRGVWRAKCLSGDQANRFRPTELTKEQRTAFRSRCGWCTWRVFSTRFNGIFVTFLLGFLADMRGRKQAWHWRTNSGESFIDDVWTGPLFHL